MARKTGRFSRRSLRREGADEDVQDLVQKEDTGVLNDHAADSTSCIVLTCRMTCSSDDVKEGLEIAQNRHVLRRGILLRVLGEKTGGESSVALDLRVGVAKRGVEELEKRLGPLRDLRLQRVDEFSKAANGGGAVTEGTVLFLRDSERLDI